MTGLRDENILTGGKRAFYNIAVKQWYADRLMMLGWFKKLWYRGAASVVRQGVDASECEEI